MLLRWYSTLIFTLKSFPKVLHFNTCNIYIFEFIFFQFGPLFPWPMGNSGPPVDHCFPDLWEFSRPTGLLNLRAMCYNTKQVRIQKHRHTSVLAFDKNREVSMHLKLFGGLKHQDTLILTAGRLSAATSYPFSPRQRIFSELFEALSNCQHARNDSSLRWKQHTLLKESIHQCRHRCR